MRLLIAVRPGPGAVRCSETRIPARSQGRNRKQTRTHARARAHTHTHTHTHTDKHPPTHTHTPTRCAMRLMPSQFDHQRRLTIYSDAAVQKRRGARVGADVAGEARDEVDEEGAGAPAALYYIILYHITLYYIVKSYHIKYRFFSSILASRALVPCTESTASPRAAPAARCQQYGPLAAGCPCKGPRLPRPGSLSKLAPRLGSAYEARTGPPHRQNRRPRRWPSGPHAPT